MFTAPVVILRGERVLLSEGDGGRRLCQCVVLIGGKEVSYWPLVLAKKELGTNLDELTCVLDFTLLSRTYSIGDAKVTLRRLCRGDGTKAGSSIAMQSDWSGVLNFI